MPPFWRYRVYGINTETGGTIGLTYSAADCKAGSVPTPTSNNRRCYPVKWSPAEAPGANYEPYLDWFHSYVVTQVLETDITGGAPPSRPTTRTWTAWPGPSRRTTNSPMPST